MKLSPTRIDAQQVRLALDIEAAGKTIRPELTLVEGGEAGTVTFPTGKTSLSLKFSMPK